MVVAGAQTPREKTFRPFFSWTTQWSPAAFTLTGQGGIAGWKNHPAFGHGQDFAIGRSDGVRGGAGDEGVGVGSLHHKISSVNGRLIWNRPLYLRQCVFNCVDHM